jgi:serine/threonine protein kinase
MTGAVAGTPSYISPEQANGERGEAASDIYSFGVVAYEMLTGQVPFEADTPLAAMLHHMNTPPPSPRSLRPDLNEAVEKVLFKALAKMPQDRFADAKTFAQMLKQAVETGKVPQIILRQSFVSSGQFPRGSVIDDRYEVEDVLGQGAFSYVYKVKDRTVDEFFALKVINDRNLALEQLKQEFQILSKLQHPLIARLVDAGKLKSGPYFIKLEYVAGKTLGDCMDDDSLTEAKKIELLEDILEALAYMESQEVIHRDLKPSNIIVTPTAAKIIDFNVSKTLQEASRTQVGNTRYMPPEVPHFGWNKTSDLYSVGLIFYELITGRLPFLDAASLDTWEIPDPREFAPALPEALAHVLVKAIARRPEDRFINATEMLAAVRRARVGAGLQGKVSPHIAPSPPQQQVVVPDEQPVAPKKSIPISLETISRLRPLVQRGSGYPLAAGKGAKGNDLILITTAGIETISPANLQTTKTIWRSHDPLTAGAVSADGRTVVVTTLTDQLLSFEANTGRQVGRTIRLPGPTATLAGNPNDQFVAVCLKNRQGLLIQMPDGRIVHRWRSGLPLLALSPAADFLAFMDEQSMLRLIEVNTLSEITRLDLLKEEARAVAFSAGGKYLAMGGKRVRWWETTTGREAGAVSAPREGVAALAFGFQEDTLTVAGDKEITFWDLSKRRKTGSVKLPGVRALNFVDSTTMFTIRAGGGVCLSDPHKKQITVERQFDSFSCAALSPDGQAVISGDKTGLVKVWSLKSEKVLWQWEADKGPIWAIALHPHKPLLSVAGTKTLWYLDLTTRQVVGQQRIDGSESRLSFSRDGRKLLLQKPGRAWLFDPNDHRAKPLQLKVETIAFTPDSKRLAATQKSKFLWIDPVNGQQRPAWIVSPAREIAFNEAGSLIAILPKEDEPSIWNNKGKRLFRLQNVQGLIHDAIFASDNVLLAALDNQGQLNFWDAAIASKQGVFPAHYGPARLAGFSRDGKKLVTAGLDGLVRWWGV